MVWMYFFHLLNIIHHFSPLFYHHNSISPITNGGLRQKLHWSYLRVLLCCYQQNLCHLVIDSYHFFKTNHYWKSVDNQEVVQTKLTCLIFFTKMLSHFVLLSFLNSSPRRRRRRQQKTVNHFNDQEIRLGWKDYDVQHHWHHHYYLYQVVVHL